MVTPTRPPPPPEDWPPSRNAAPPLRNPGPPAYYEQSWQNPASADYDPLRVVKERPVVANKPPPPPNPPPTRTQRF